MISYDDICKKVDNDLKLEFLDFMEIALIIHSINDGINHTNNVIRINEYQKEILLREYNKQLNVVKTSTGFYTIEDLVNVKRKEFISKGYFNDGYTVRWLNNFLFIEELKRILKRFNLIEKGQIIYNIEKYNDPDHGINESEFIKDIVIAYNGVAR